MCIIDVVTIKCIRKIYYVKAVLPRLIMVYTCNPDKSPPIEVNCDQKKKKN